MESNRYFQILLLLSLSLLYFGTEASQNLALEKTAVQSSIVNPRYVASRAVDGDINQDVFAGNFCSHTFWEPIQEAWWQVDLGSTSDIKSVTIYYRQNDSKEQFTRRLSGFEVKVSTTSSNWKTRQSCYTDDNQLPYPPDILNVPCVDQGKFLTIYNKHYAKEDAQYGPILELCEVQVFGCTKGFYGRSDCSQQCPFGCFDSTCDPDNGICKQGCKNGWTRDRCDTGCDYGTFGYNCTSTCYCRVGCNNVNGICLKPGCQAGWTGDNCTTECSATTFGEDCATTCHCNTGGCDRFSGKCITPKCKPGWRTDSCSSKCSLDTFGEDCSRKCNCATPGCDYMTGVCDNGTECLTGWKGFRCDIPCQENTFGPNCIQHCNCLNGTCYITNGTCTVSGCEAGRTEKTCTKYCENGVFVFNCSSTCFCAEGSCIKMSADYDTPGCQKSWEGVTCNEISVESKQNRPESNEINVVPAVVGIVIAMLLAAILCVIIVFAFRRKRKNRNQSGVLAPKYNDLVEKGDDNIEETEYHEIKGIEAQNSLKTTKTLVNDIYEEMNDSISRTRIEVKNLKTVFSQSKASGDFDNQYKSVNDSSDYVVTEGPRETAIDDFWRMIWQIKCGKIVMLTNLVENGKVKCAKYWPEYSESMIFDDLEITLDTDIENLYFSIRMLIVTHIKTGEIRSVQHLHFTAWPDHGTPDPLQLMLFHRRYIEILFDQTGPTVIQSCSGDSGRTGTFIALDAIYKEGKKTGEIDVFKFVSKNPITMIQTKEQYLVLHEALVEAFQFKDTAHKKDVFCDSIYENDTGIKEEFKMLNQSKPIFDQIDAYKSARQKENQFKNRTESILPVDQYRPYLMSHSPARTDYINAVILPSFREHVGFLVTQYPIADTVVDLWCMIYDHDSSTVVTLDKLPKNEDVEWLPRDLKELVCGSFTVRRTRKPDISETVKETELEVGFKDIKRAVKLFQYQDWESNNDIPSSTNGFLKLIGMVNNWKKAGEKGPITVICKDGSKCCEVFCLIYNIIQSLKYEDRIDIFQSVRLLQLRRPEFFPSIEQYQFCYKAVQEYLESSHA